MANKDKDRAAHYVMQNKIKMNIQAQEGSLFADQERKRRFLGKEQLVVVALAVILLLTLIISFLTVVVITEDFSLAWVLTRMTRRINDLADFILGNPLGSGIHFFLCQFLSPILAGGAMAAAGACYQGVFHNPMASPTLLGVQSGGALGAAVNILFFSTLFSLQDSGSGYRTYGDYVEAYQAQNIFQHNIQQLFVFAGCILIVTIVVAIAKTANHGRLNTVSLMLGGTIFTTMITSVLNMIQYFMTMTGRPEDVVLQIQALATGRFTPVNIPEVLLCMAVPIVISLILLVMLSNKLNAIVFGEEEAKTLGMNVERYRIILIGLSTLMTASVVAFCGQISFIGLIIPQLARFLVGPDFRYLIPASIFLGGLFMLLAWDVVYMVDFRFNMGTIVNGAGGVLFLIMMMRYRRKGNADWT